MLRHYYYYYYLHILFSTNKTRGYFKHKKLRKNKLLFYKFEFIKKKFHISKKDENTLLKRTFILKIKNLSKFQNLLINFCYYNVFLSKNTFIAY